MSYILKREKYDKPLLHCSENQGWLIKGSHTIFLPVGKQLWAITEPWDVRVKVNVEIKSYLHPKAEFLPQPLQQGIVFLAFKHFRGEILIAT